MTAPQMEEALTKIRPHTSSSLAHQKTPATLLRALEATLQEQKTEKSPTAYFASILTTLDGTLQKKDIGLGDGDVLPAELYLLALVIPFVPPPVIRANLNTLLSLSAPLFSVLQSHAPPLRSQLTLYDWILKSLDRSQLEAPGVRQAFASILQLCLDPRPKVRRRAADVVKDALAAPPPPMARHPYAERVADWIKTCLAEVNSAVFPSKAAGKTIESPTAETAIHILAFLRPVLLNLPPAVSILSLNLSIFTNNSSKSLPSITNFLLTLPRLGNPYLSQSAYSILSDLFSAPAEDEASNVTDEIPAVLKAVLSSPPSKADATLSPSWVSVLGNAMLAYSVFDPNACAAELGRVWKTVWTFLESDHAATRKASAESLDLLSQCFTPDMIQFAIQETNSANAEPKSVLGSILSQADKAFGSISFARSIPELLSVISSLIKNLRYNEGDQAVMSADEILLLPLIRKIGDLRTDKKFEHKEAADATLATAMRVFGPEVLLKALPLNLEPADR
jgi:ribosomal RNA-processing protein 12